MSFEPWINFQFHKAPGWIDPRFSFTRASVGRTVNRAGQLVAVPANTARYRFNPLTRLCEGLWIESQRTNYLLRSEEFDNPVWTATNLTVTPNSTTAPDGTISADTLAATGSGGTIAQAVTITAGRGIALSLYAKANASSFLYAKLSDGTSTVECWWNLAAGAVGTSTSGSGTCVFAQKLIEAADSGWYRCSLEVTTATSTTFTASFAPAAADNTVPAAGNSLYAWGAQLEAEGTTNTNPTSYIPTTSATVTRSADNLLMPVTAAQVPLDRGTMIFDIVARPLPPVTSGVSVVLGGIGNTSGFTDFLYISRNGPTGLAAAYSSTNNPGTPSQPSRVCLFTPGVTYRFGVTWQSNRIATSIDGGSVGVGTSNIVPLTQVGRIAIGCAPWSSSSAGTVGHCIFRAFQYAPHTVADAVLQQLTAP